MWNPFNGLAYVHVAYKKLHPDAKAPWAGTQAAAGADLHAVINDGDDEEMHLMPGERCQVSTGIALEIPEGFEGQVRPRSGLAAKHGIMVVNAPGTIDADYRGEIKVLLINTSKEVFHIKTGDRIAQLIIAPVMKALYNQAAELNSTYRGEGGFGSTGTR